MTHGRRARVNLIPITLRDRQTGRFLNWHQIPNHKFLFFLIDRSTLPLNMHLNTIVQICKRRITIFDLNRTASHNFINWTCIAFKTEVSCEWQSIVFARTQNLANNNATYSDTTCSRHTCNRLPHGLMCLISIRLFGIYFVFCHNNLFG